jgi:hypothetical protein
MFWGRKYFSQCRRFGQIKLDSSLIDDPPVTLFLNRPTWHNQNQTGLEIPNSKSQIPNKFQISISNDQNAFSFNWNFGHWKLFVI